MPKRTVLDPQGQTIQHALSGLGYGSIKDVRQGKFFVLNVEGLTRDEAEKQVDRISRSLTNAMKEYPTRAQSKASRWPSPLMPKAEPGFL